MTDKIDVRDLPQEDVRQVEEYVALLRRQKQQRQIESERDYDAEPFPVQNLGIKGLITRKEIYDDL